MGKKKSSRRIKYDRFDEEHNRSTGHKRIEVDPTNFNSNQKNMNKNQVEDESKCKESFAEGKHTSINNTTDNIKLDSFEKRKSLTKKNSFDLPKNELINEAEKKKVFMQLDTSESTNKKHKSINNTTADSNKLDLSETRKSSTKKNSFDLSKNELINKAEKKVSMQFDTSESTNKNLLEIDADIFKIPPLETSLACCVAADFKMESEIGVKFKGIFGDIDKLIEQNLKVGDIGQVNRHNQYAFYLVTKQCSSSKSKMKKLVQVFKNLIKKMEDMNLTKLAIAKTNFESEGPSWCDIKKSIIEIIDNSNIHLTVCSHSEEIKNQQGKNSFGSSTKTHNEVEVCGSANKLSNQRDKAQNRIDCNIKCETDKKKKKMRKNDNDQNEDNVDSNKDTKHGFNILENKSATKSQCNTFSEDDHLHNNASQELKKDKHSKKSLSNKTSIKNKNKCVDDRFSSVSEDAKCTLEEIDSDLFDLPNEFALAHCVAEDLRMGAGIAVEFKQRFGGVGKLVDQNLKVGSVGLVQRHNQNAFYLVTKKYSNGKPTMHTMEMALHSLVKMMKDHNVSKLGIPKIGCGLDGLDWDNVKSLIMKIFDGFNVNITVCIPSKFLDRKAPSPLKVYITRRNLWQMESQTTIIMLIDLEQIYNQHWSDNVVDEVNSRYPFKENLLKDVKKKNLSPGAIQRYSVKDECLICVFFHQNIYYDCLENALKDILHSSKNFLYLAIQSGSVAENFKRISWFVLILRSISNVHQCELWLCGDTEQTDETMVYDQFCRNVRYSMDRSTSRVIYKSNSSATKGYSQNYGSSPSFSKTCEAGLILFKENKAHHISYDTARLSSADMKQMCSINSVASAWSSGEEKQTCSESFNEVCVSSPEEKQMGSPSFNVSPTWVSSPEEQQMHSFNVSPW